jgi:hypothetical protein
MRPARGHGLCPRHLQVAALLALGTVVVFASGSASAAALPEDRADAMYHYYNGGGTTVDGPALLVREGVGDNTSVQASYYADSVSGASIDVVTTASPYKDKRDEYGISADYLYRDSVLSASFTTSRESDYFADTFGFNVTQDLMDGLTTLSLGYSAGHDVVLRNTDASFVRTIDRYQYRLGLSQVITKSLLMSLNYEVIADDGYLNNPYRSALVLGSAVPEKYPLTRDSHAVAMKLRKGLDLFDKQELRSALQFDYRLFWDTWDINANTLEIGYHQYFGKRLMADLHYRYYSQDKAVFYSDNFPGEFLYMARDKELSAFKDHSLGFKISYHWVDRGSFKFSQSFAYDYLKFKYDDFTDLRTGELYSFNASTAQLFLSFWY